MTALFLVSYEHVVRAMTAHLLSVGRCSESDPSFDAQDSHSFNDKLDSVFLSAPQPLQALIEVSFRPLIVLMSEEQMLPSITKNSTAVVSWLLAGVSSSESSVLSVSAKVEVAQLNREAFEQPEW